MNKGLYLPKKKRLVTAVASANLQILVKNCLAMLEKHYPGHRWIVGGDDVGGIVNITLPDLSGLYGITLHITKIDNDFQKIKAAGGELLERFRLARGRANPEAVRNIERMFTGDAVFDE